MCSKEYSRFCLGLDTNPRKVKWKDTYEYEYEYEGAHQHQSPKASGLENDTQHYLSDSYFSSRILYIQKLD